ncbi:MAG: DUF4202 domain-containing protein [Alphaproteobacteria bacterium]|nr:DUF4202 domain-containing protein [Alphaproteobacteria bacterium]
MSNARLDAALSGIDAANGADPNRVSVDGADQPAELVYGERMSRTLSRLYPDASEHLRIAARGQHIERWTSPRADYPMDREGYLRWRTALKRYHADRVGEIMREAGYGDEDIDQVGRLIQKHRLKRDPEAQALEDVVCVVFLEDYFADFALKHEDAKVVDILRKTWKKMSPVGHEAALALDLPPDARRLVEAALAPDAPGS